LPKLHRKKRVIAKITPQGFAQKKRLPQHLSHAFAQKRKEASPSLGSPNGVLNRMLNASFIGKIIGANLTFLV
jgi:hypothetical protein